jgi:hypothetical protein
MLDSLTYDAKGWPTPYSFGLYNVAGHHHALRIAGEPTERLAPRSLQGTVPVIVALDL